MHQVPAGRRSHEAANRVKIDMATPTESEQKIASLRQAVNVANQQRARAEANRDQLDDTVTRTRAAMVAKFGVDSVEAAHAKLAEMDQELNQLFAAATDALARATAQ